MRKSFFFAAFILCSLTSFAQNSENALAVANQKCLDVAKWADVNVAEVSNAKAKYKVAFEEWSLAVEIKAKDREELYIVQSEAELAYYRILALQPEVIAAKKELALARQNAIAENSNN